MSTFSIDFDGTWTTDPEAFAAFAALLRRRGHRVIVITARVSALGEVREACGPYVDRVLATLGVSKSKIATERGETVDVWIDDRPDTV